MIQRTAKQISTAYPNVTSILYYFLLTGQIYLFLNESVEVSSAPEWRQSSILWIQVLWVDIFTSMESSIIGAFIMSLFYGFLFSDGWLHGSAFVTYLSNSLLYETYWNNAKFSSFLELGWNLPASSEMKAGEGEENNLYKQFFLQNLNKTKQTPPNINLRLFLITKIHTIYVYKQAQRTCPLIVTWNQAAQFARPVIYKNVLSYIYAIYWFICGLDSALKLMHFLSLGNTRHSRVIIVLTLRRWPSCPIVVTSGRTKNMRRKF